MNTISKVAQLNQKKEPPFIPVNFKKVKPSSPLSIKGDDNYSTGLKVQHDRFGIGVIFKVEGNGANKKISINFTDVGEKTLLVKFAKLVILK